MTGHLQIRPMSLQDLNLAVDWAAAEGWNPGLEDASAFYPVDPEGFLMGWLGDKPVSAISVVRHSDLYGFLGFYLCDPAYRGRGHGLAIWNAGMAYLAGRTVGLDGVPEQQGNYESSGFRLAHYSRRYAGRVLGSTDTKCRLAEPKDIPALLALDREISGTDRTAYLGQWLRQTRGRQTAVLESDGQITSVGTIRTCRDGHKIGPLFSSDANSALRLLNALVAIAGADNVMIDIPDPNTAAVEIAANLGLTSVFTCARMYRGAPLERRVGQIFGETTFELG